MTKFLLYMYVALHNDKKKKKKKKRDTKINNIILKYQIWDLYHEYLGTICINWKQKKYSIFSHTDLGRHL